MSFNPADVDLDLGPMIDHAALDPAATDEQIKQACAEADRFGFATVCIYPTHVRLAVEQLRQRPPGVCVVIGFPSGATTSAVKIYEAQEALEDGADELDMVINLGWVRSGQSNPLSREISEICGLSDKPVKAVLEMSRLTLDEQRLAIEICMDSGVTFLKTSTGWAGPATVEQIQFLREVTKGKIGLKAAGGIRTYAQAAALVMAGATRLGTSAGVALLKEKFADQS
jgi:deoxyribose-phosphate aldolase